MKANPSMQKPFTRIRIAAAMLMLAMTGLLVWTPGWGSHAQQRDRQLVQTGSANASAAKRIALVIGNGNYTSAPPLKNPPNDARDMAATLKTLGFDVSSGVNVSQREMKRLIREFGQKLKAGGSGLFFYAGHGVQSNGRNYLIPVEADIQSEAEVEDSSVDVTLVLKYMDDAQNGLNIVVLDACRNNPFARSFRSASSGLAQVDAPTGTLIAYATAPGRVASDGTGLNGLYTSALLKQMRVPGLSATDMFMRVRAEVMKQTGNKQVPWEASSLVGAFYFTASRNAVTLTEPVNESNVESAAFELSYWETIKNSTSADDFKAYLFKYPNGQFAELAKNKIKSLEIAAKPIEPVRDSGNSGAIEVAFWDYIKNGNNVEDFQAYLKKYPSGAFADLANNRLRSLEAANKAKGKIFEVDWEEAADRYKTARLVILDNRFRFERDQQDIRADGQLRAQLNKEDLETSIARLNRWYNDAWNCTAFKASKTDGLFIGEIQPTKTDLGSWGSTYRLRFKSPDEAVAALAAVRELCTTHSSIQSSAGLGNSLEGTTWKGVSPGGDKHYEFQFLPNGEVIWHLTWGQLGNPTYRGTWTQTATTIHMEFPDGPTGGANPVEATISGDKITGSWNFGSAGVRWDKGMYKFSVQRAP